MPTTFYTPTQVDDHCGWPWGRAQKLARAGKVAHTRLVDGSIRFTLEQIEQLGREVPAGPGPLRFVPDEPAPSK